MLVIEAEHAGEDPGDIPGAAREEAGSAWRAPAERHREVVAWLAAAGAAVTDSIRPPALADGWALPALRWYQDRALAEWQASGRRGTVALPTGAGKTVLALAAIAAVASATLVIVPTRVLLDQWVRAIEGCWPYPVGRIGDGDYRLAPITVATYASAAAWAPRIGDRFGLVVVDEAHHVGGGCPAGLLEMLVAPARLGLTATLPTEPDALVRHVGPAVYTCSVDELIGDALAPYDLVTIPIALSAEERQRYRELRGQFRAVYGEAMHALGALGWVDFVRAASRYVDGRCALRAWRGYRALVAYPAGKREVVRRLLARHRGARTLVFTGDNATAYAIARELLVTPITHEIGRAERARALERFRAGELPVLVSAHVLDEGVDVPEAEIAIVVGGTASERRHVQRIGRVLRPSPGKRATVYELIVPESHEVAAAERRRGAVAEGSAGIDRGQSGHRDERGRGEGTARRARDARWVVPPAHPAPVHVVREAATGGPP